MTSDLDPTRNPQVTRGQIIVVASPKGGVGKSTVATNLAILLAKQAPLQTVLVDLDLQFGDVASQLDLKPDHTISDAVSAGLSDTMLFKTFLAPHSSGLLVLAGVESPLAGGRISDEQAVAVLEFLAAEFPVVIVDTASGLVDHTLAALELATDVVLVTNMGVSSIKSLRRELDLLAALDLTFTRHVVLNFCDRISGLTVEVAAGVVGCPIDVVLPRVEDGPLAANLGIPIVLRKKPGVMGKGLSDLAGRLGLRSMESPVEAEADRWHSMRWRSQGEPLSAEETAGLEQAPEPEQTLELEPEQGASRMSWRERKSKRERGEGGQAQEERTEQELAPYGLAEGVTSQVARAEEEQPEVEQAAEEQAEVEQGAEEQAEVEQGAEEQAEDEQPEGEQAAEEQSEEEQLEVEQAEAEQAEEEQLEVEQPEVEQPEVEQAEEEQLEVEQPEVEQAEGEQAEEEQAEEEQAEEEQAEEEQAEEEQAEEEQPEGEQAEEEQPEGEQPEVEQAEEEQPEVEQAEEEQAEEEQAEEEQAEHAQAQGEQGGRRKRWELKGRRPKGVEGQDQEEIIQTEQVGRRKRRDGKRRRVTREKEQAQDETSQEKRS